MTGTSSCFWGLQGALILLVGALTSACAAGVSPQSESKTVDERLYEMAMSIRVSRQARAIVLDDLVELYSWEPLLPRSDSICKENARQICEAKALAAQLMLENARDYCLRMKAQAADYTCPPEDGDPERICRGRGKVALPLEVHVGSFVDSSMSLSIHALLKFAEPPRSSCFRPDSFRNLNAASEQFFEVFAALYESNYGTELRLPGCADVFFQSCGLDGELDSALFQFEQLEDTR